MDTHPSCAICSGPAEPECPCESDRLQIAVKQAEGRAFDKRLQEIRDWVVERSRAYIVQSFTSLTNSRKVAHATYLTSLPYYSIYMQYGGHPPLHPAALHHLNQQILDANHELKRGIDADWRASVMRYPEVLDYYYSLIELRMPSDKASSVIEGPSGYKDREKDVKREKKRRSEREVTAPPMERPSGRRRDSGTAKLKAPPVVPTPPIMPGGYGGSGGYYGY
ncbi:hypothetical protein M501DRAFT_1002332 [Patellaria atrata CBS 101060]|uniref:Uncharacterized protein n=1 Tax=Patellaria atrata CBS 101060 TaxID=1346257 RepID=A0A9P4SCF2_9PEZI|nr:hypothetical protein M501DRAFT_1002332 [Patellaria atrata CBS 101060]